MITSSNSLSRGSVMPNQVHGALVHAMSGNELSRVRTELDRLRILPTVPPHPVQPNSKPSGHGHLGDSAFSTHRQMQVPAPSIRITTHGGLCCFHQQKTQQRIALLADVSQPLPSGTGVLRRDQPHITAGLLAAMEPLWSSDDQHEGQRRQWSYAGVRHQL